MSPHNALAPEEVRAWEQLSYRRGYRSDGHTQRVAQWEIDAWYTMIERLITLSAEPGAQVRHDGITLDWPRYRGLLMDSERVNQIERWAREGLMVGVSALGDAKPCVVSVGEQMLVCPDLREAIDTHVRADGSEKGR